MSDIPISLIHLCHTARFWLQKLCDSVGLNSQIELQSFLKITLFVAVRHSVFFKAVSCLELFHPILMLQQQIPVDAGSYSTNPSNRLHLTSNFCTIINLYWGSVIFCLLWGTCWAFWVVNLHFFQFPSFLCQSSIVKK